MRKTPATSIKTMAVGWLWDRLFGTFAEERQDEPCRYGITHQLQLEPYLGKCSCGGYVDVVDTCSALA